MDGQYWSVVLQRVESLGTGRGTVLSKAAKSIQVV